MSRTFKGIIITAIALIAIAGALSAFVLSGGCSAGVPQPIDDVKNTAMNALLDTTGVKARIEEELHAHSSDIAERAGIPQAVVDNAIDSLDIQEWKVTTLPADTAQASTFSLDTGDVSARVTTYDDPGIITVDAYGQTLTMEIPESAQAYTTLLGLLGPDGLSL